MRNRIIRLFLIIFFTGTISCRKETPPDHNAGLIQLVSVKIGSTTLDVNATVKNVPYDQPVQLSFTSEVDTGSIRKAISIRNSNGTFVTFTYSYTDSSSTLTLTPASLLGNFTDYTLTISGTLKGAKGETFPGVQFQFTTLAGSMVIDSITLNGIPLTASPLLNIDPNKIEIKVTFSQALDAANYQSSFSFTGPVLSFTLSGDSKTVTATNITAAQGLTRYTFSVSSALTSAGGFTFAGFSSSFYTRVDSTYQVPPNPG